ncbi:MAG: AAA family ATPase, partial [Shewanella sp.]|nr:AAA family ATPase [Shewanella sp.]
MPLSRFHALREYLNQVILGQPVLTENLLIALIADGHLLVEGPPGLAKTRAVKALCDGVEGDFHRIQFTPDLLPADLTGTDIYRAQTATFEFEAGPIFHNLILADEINRAPAKVQSALLEAMGEGQVTVGKNSYKLPELFLVMATQNPLENEGTYPLPEAQLDRFLMHLKLDYPNAETELKIMRMSRKEALKQAAPTVEPIIQKDIFAAREESLELYLAEPLEKYIVDIV